MEAVKRRNDKARARRCELGFAVALAARLEAVDCDRVAGERRHLGSSFIEVRRTCEMPTTLRSSGVAAVG